MESLCSSVAVSLCDQWPWSLRGPYRASQFELVTAQGFSSYMWLVSAVLGGELWNLPSKCCPWSHTEAQPQRSPLIMGLAAGHSEAFKGGGTRFQVEGKLQCKKNCPALCRTPISGFILLKNKSQ